MFSKEYLFQKIEKEHHCLGVTLKNSIKWDDEIVNTIYVVELVMEDDDKESLLRNITNLTDTYGKIVVKAFIKEPFETKEIQLNTSDIVEIEGYRI